MSTVRSRIAARPLRLAVVIALLLAGAVFVLIWFEPQALFIDERVDESIPGVESETSDETTTQEGDAAAAEAPAFEVLRQGAFRSLDHPGEGQARVLELRDGKRLLRFEDFMVENGPALEVYLSTAPAGADPATFDDDFVSLGALKGNVGDQNYELPAGVDLDDYKSAVVWCVRFSVGFAVAPLN